VQRYRLTPAPRCRGNKLGDYLDDKCKTRWSMRGTGRREGVSRCKAWAKARPSIAPLLFASVVFLSINLASDQSAPCVPVRLGAHFLECARWDRADQGKGKSATAADDAGSRLLIFRRKLRTPAAFLPSRSYHANGAGDCQRLNIFQRETAPETCKMCSRSVLAAAARRQKSRKRVDMVNDVPRRRLERLGRGAARDKSESKRSNRQQGCCLGGASCTAKRFFTVGPARP
jgi:hypothetical protein